MRATSLILAAATMTFAAAAIAGPAKKAVPPPAMEHAAVVEARQAGFHLTLAAFLQIKGGITRGADVKTLALPAAAIAGWGRSIPTMFPPGTDLPSSDAMPNVWTDKAGFAAAATKMADAAGTLAELGKAGDTAGFAAQWDVLKTACGECHTKYRKPEEKH